jgi:DNA helicase TIP49 (TBP-interacting protein)
MKILVETYSGKVYILEAESQKKVYDMTIGQEVVEMPNGDIVKTANISEIISYESYKFQIDQKNRHKKGQYLSKGNWKDNQGVVKVADLQAITGKLKLLK